MKKRLLILAIGSMCLSFAGCSNSDNRSNGSKSSSVEADSKVVTDVDSSDHDVTTEENNLSNADMSKILLGGIGKILPDPSEYFQGKLDGGDHGDSLDMWIENTTVDEFNTYMDKCKEAGFTKVDNSGADESGILYWALPKTRSTNLLYSTIWLKKLPRLVSKKSLNNLRKIPPQLGNHRLSVSDFLGYRSLPCSYISR